MSFLIANSRCPRLRLAVGSGARGNRVNGTRAASPSGWTPAWAAASSSRSPGGVPPTFANEARRLLVKAAWRCRGYWMLGSTDDWAWLHTDARPAGLAVHCAGGRPRRSKPGAGCKLRTFARDSLPVHSCPLDWSASRAGRWPRRDARNCDSPPVDRRSSVTATRAHPTPSSMTPAAVADTTRQSRCGLRSVGRLAPRRCRCNGTFRLPGPGQR